MLSTLGLYIVYNIKYNKYIVNTTIMFISTLFVLFTMYLLINQTHYNNLIIFNKKLKISIISSFNKFNDILKNKKTIHG